MKPTAELIPAPKRGQYQRGLSRNERQAVQRERVIAAIAAVAGAGRVLSVANVVSEAGIGRNTFYEYFDDVDHALDQINGRTRRDFAARVESALKLARTPLERVRTLARAYAEALFAEPALVQLALRAQPTARDSVQLSALGRHIADVLTSEAESLSALPGVSDRLRTNAVGALFDTVGRSHLAERAMAIEELQRFLAELALRLLR